MKAKNKVFISFDIASILPSGEHLNDESTPARAKTFAKLKAILKVVE